MHCYCGFLMQVRSGGGFYCSRCGNVEGAPARVRKNRAAACVTDQSSRPVEVVDLLSPEARVDLSEIGKPLDFESVGPAPDETVEVGAPSVPRGTVQKPRPVFGRGGKK